MKLFFDFYVGSYYKCILFDDDGKKLDEKILKLSNGLKIFDNYDIYYDSGFYIKDGDNKLSIPIIFGEKIVFFKYLSNLNYMSSYISYFVSSENISKQYNIDDYFDIENKRIHIIDTFDTHNIEIIINLEPFSYEFFSYILKDDKKILYSPSEKVDVPFVYLYKIFNHDLYKYFMIYWQIKNPYDSIISHFNNVETNIKIPIENKIDTVKSDITSKLDNLDFTKLKEDLKSLFSMNLTKISLNGANGSKFADGDQVVIDNFVGVWKVLSSFQAVVDDNNLTILYQVQKDDKTMIVPSAFVTQGA